MQQARDKAAEDHESAAQFWDEHDDAERADKERELAQKDREGWRLEGEREPLSGERDASRQGESAGELGEDRQVGVQSHPLKPMDTQGQ